MRSLFSQWGESLEEHRIKKIHSLGGFTREEYLEIVDRLSASFSEEKRRENLFLEVYRLAANQVSKYEDKKAILRLEELLRSWISR